jgi:hypothetical protein
MLSESGRAINERCYWLVKDNNVDFCITKYQL